MYLGLVLAVTLLVFTGCGSGGTTTESAAKQLADAGGSVYGQTTYEVQALLVNPSNRPTPLPALAVYGSPTSTYRKHMRPFAEQYDAETKAIQRSIAETDAKITSGMAELSAAESKLADEYAEIRPKESDGPASTSRNPLRELSKIRAAKTKSDEWYKEAYAERIAPIKATLLGLYRAKEQAFRRELALRASFNNRLFDALEAMPASDCKVWKTAGDGKVRITVTNAEPWTVWAKTSHAEMVAVVTKMSGDIRTRRTAEYQRLLSQNPKVEVTFDVDYDLEFRSRPEFQTTSVRWLLDVPDDLDSNSLLSLDQNTAFDLKDISLESAGSDGPYLKKSDGKK